MLHRHALCVGINRYPNLPTVSLQGCVQDAQDMAELLTDRLGFRPTEVTPLVDEAATKSRILAELGEMVQAALAGRLDHLVFSFSGYGTQVPDLNPEAWDRADDAFCPSDLALRGIGWDLDHLMVDGELHDLFVQLPPTVILEVYLDTCHSGAGLRAADLLLDRKPRYLPPPTLEAFRDIEFRQARPAHVKLLEKGLSHHILWTAARENQVAAEAYLDGGWHGAFTWHFCREARFHAPDGTRAQVLAGVRADLRRRHFTQVPQLDSEAVTRHGPLKAVAVPPNLEPLPMAMPT